MVTFTIDGQRKVSIGIFEALTTQGRTLRRTKKRIPAHPIKIHGDAPAGEVPAPVVETEPAQETAPGWTAEEDKQLLELHRIGIALSGKQGIKERYKQLTKDETAQVKDIDETATTAEAGTNWTAEEDEQLTTLKKEKKSWKEIEAAMGGKKGARNRYKELNKDAAATGDDTGDEAEANDKGTPMSTSLVITDDELEKKPSFCGQSIKPVVRLEDGEELDYQQMIYLWRLQEFFEAQKWVNVASKFFDKTGKRIEATELRAKFSGLWTGPPPAQ